MIRRKVYLNNLDFMINKTKQHFLWGHEWSKLKQICLGSKRQFQIKYSSIFSSQELKAEVSYSDHISSVCLSVCNIFHFFSKTARPLSIKFGTMHSYEKANINSRNEIPIFIQSGVNLEIVEKGGMQFLKSSSQE